LGSRRGGGEDGGRCRRPPWSETANIQGE
jgi:hypothetical protein